MSSKLANSKQRIAYNQKPPAVSCKTNAFSVLEIVLAIGLFAVIVSGAVGAVIQAFSATRLGEETTNATFLATEGLEAVRAIQERDFWVLAPGTYGLRKDTGQWEFFGTQNSFGKYTRQIIISDVYRDSGGNIVESGEVLDLYTKRVEAVVTWSFGPARQNTVRLPTYFTYWEAALCVWDTGHVVATLDLPGVGDGTAIVNVENKAYVTTMRNATTSGEFFIIDLSNPLTPEILGKVKVGDHVHDLDILGNFAYLATASSQKELVVVDISTPTSPAVVASYDIPNVSQAYSISIEEEFAYVVTPQSTTDAELYIFNISNPLLPMLVGKFEVGNHVYGIKAKEKRVYLANARVDKELMIVDVANPSNPLELGSYNIPLAGANGQSVDIIRAGVAYLGTRANAGGIPEFYLLAVANPAMITLIGSYDVSGRVNGVGVGTGFALLATEKSEEEFLILDLSNPKNPQKAFSTSLNGIAGGVSFTEEEESCVAYFVTADDNAEFQVVQP